MSSSDHYNRAEVRTCFCCLDKYGKPKVFKHRSGLSVHKKSKGHKDKEAQWEQFHMQAQIRIQAQNQPAQIQRQIKKKENQVVEFLRKTNETKDIEWIIDNPIEIETSVPRNKRRRPDVFGNVPGNIIIVEVDEEQHKTKDPQDELERKRIIMEDLQEYQKQNGLQTKVKIIRFNPDEYTDNNGIHHPSCWQCNMLDHDENIRRLSVLKDTILERNNTDNFQEIKLFYDDYCQ